MTADDMLILIIIRWGALCIALVYTVPTIAKTIHNEKTPAANFIFTGIGWATFAALMGWLSP